MTRKEWAALPLWDGLPFDADDGTQYRGTFRGRDYIITVHVRDDCFRYSASEEVTFSDDG